MAASSTASPLRSTGAESRPDTGRGVWCEDPERGDATAVNDGGEPSRPPSHPTARLHHDIHRQSSAEEDRTSQGVDRPRRDEWDVVTAPRVGETFHFDLDGTSIAASVIEVDAPHRMLLSWDRREADAATLTPAFIEITLTPAGDGTDVRVELSGLSAEDAAFHQQLWARHLDRIATAFAGADPAHGN
jgi:hypothetical protein